MISWLRLKPNSYEASTVTPRVELIVAPYVMPRRAPQLHGVGVQRPRAVMTGAPVVPVILRPAGAPPLLTFFQPPSIPATIAVGLPRGLASAGKPFFVTFWPSPRLNAS